MCTEFHQKWTQNMWRTCCDCVTASSQVRVTTPIFTKSTLQQHFVTAVPSLVEMWHTVTWLTLRHRRMDRRDIQIRRRSSAPQRTPNKWVPHTAYQLHGVRPDTVPLSTSRNLVSKPGLCFHSLSCVTFQNRVVYKHFGFLPHREHCQSLLQRTTS
jgi:hypothetical protein